jgi:Uma2 family endonuclease
MTPAPVLTKESSIKFPEQGEWTYADFQNLPDDGKRYEIINGVLYVTNTPSYAHQYISAFLFNALFAFVISNKLGIVLSAPFEVIMGGIATPIQPDILFINADNQPQLGDKNFVGVPDLVVEVLSPSTFRKDQRDKLDAYELAGVKEYWIADPKTRSIIVYMLPEGGREYVLLGQFTQEETLESNVLDGFKLQLSTVFPN